MITFSDRFEKVFDALYDNTNNLSKFVIIDFAITKTNLVVMKIILIYHIIFIEMSNDFK